ncbi:hypothetical protein H0H81_009094 [Sphagnurus paluster]|uniref:Uncharacterized protein n=1 Tax=Sphagnurus paluster TaxID=117069 RepID=A0A9P7GJT6_9AGAR|nr:hypothetical protein H0H81_009094 [Sphagnurus paluster]
MRLSSFIFFASLVASGFASTAADFKADIATISSRLQTLEKAVTAFPVTGGTFLQAFAIHNSAVDLATALQSCAKDTKAVTPTPFSSNDGREILTAAENLEGTMYHAIDGIIARKDQFFKVPFGYSYIQGDISNMGSSLKNVEDALISASPVSLLISSSLAILRVHLDQISLLAEANEFKSRIDNGFASAAAAFP